MFSPYYAAARRLGRADPENFCAVNVALYRPTQKVWAMTERTRRDLSRDATSLVIGPSSLRYVDGGLDIALAERSVPVPRRIIGHVRLKPVMTNASVVYLDAAMAHRWQPLSPRARVTVDFEAPKLHWQGNAYLDANDGDEPLEQAFTSWHWARVHASSNTTVLYDIIRRDASFVSVAQKFDDHGRIEVGGLPPLRFLASSGWRVGRQIRAIDQAATRVIRTLEDTPFYARSLVATDLGEGPVVALHESLSLDRVANPVVRCMLPFRMPRRRFYR